YQRDITQHVLCPVFAGYQSQVLAAKKKEMSWQEILKPEIPIIPNQLPSRYQKAVTPYLPVMKFFRSIRGDVVCGDTGVSSFFALPPFDCIDITTYMGGSIPLATGAMLSGHRNVWAVTGDFAFCAAGHLGFMEAFQRHLPVKILILNNHKAESTGGQTVPGELLEMVLEAFQPWVRKISHPDDESEIRMILEEASRAQDMRIVVVDYQ
ncbi:MAG: thiamine pyrophosphate-dependent enzyme, partial [Atribacterota bacterium]